MQRDTGLECDDEVYLDSFKPTLMDVFYDWSLGKSFADVSGGAVGGGARRLLCCRTRAVSQQYCTGVLCEQVVAAGTLIACLLLRVWCCNLQVAKKTDIFEGSIIRVARRLDELMQQLARAARVIGDEKLAARFEESNETLRRGIMFSASLYL